MRGEAESMKCEASVKYEMRSAAERAVSDGGTFGEAETVFPDQSLTFWCRVGQRILHKILGYVS